MKCWGDPTEGDGCCKANILQESSDDSAEEDNEEDEEDGEVEDESDSQ